MLACLQVNPSFVVSWLWKQATQVRSEHARVISSRHALPFTYVEIVLSEQQNVYYLQLHQLYLYVTMLFEHATPRNGTAS